MKDNNNQFLKESILFALESVLFTFSIFGSWMMQHTLKVNFMIEVAVQCCIIAFYFIRLWGSEELTEKPANIYSFLMAVIPVFLILTLNGFKIQKDVSWTIVPLSLITATCEELHFRVNGCHLFREGGVLGFSDCAVLIAIYSVCRIFTFIVEGVSLSVMSVLESFASGILLLGYYLKTGNTKTLIIIHTMLLIVESIEFKSEIPVIELVNISASVIIGASFLKRATLKRTATVSE